MKPCFIGILCVFLCASASALTLSESKVVKHARAELQAAQGERDQAKADEAQAETDADSATWWAKDAESRAAEAQKAADAEHAQLVKAVAQNAELRPIVEECKKWWGIGAIIYGFKRLAVHLFILIAALAVLGVLLAWFFPPVLGIFRLIWGRIAAAGSALIAKERARFEVHYEQPSPEPPPAPPKAIRHSSSRSRR